MNQDGSAGWQRSYLGEKPPSGADPSGPPPDAFGELKRKTGCIVGVCIGLILLNGLALLVGVVGAIMTDVGEWAWVVAAVSGLVQIALLAAILRFAGATESWAQETRERLARLEQAPP